MAKKAGVKLSAMMPKLVFRENGAVKAEGLDTLKETHVESNWVNIDKTQSFKTVFLGDSSVGKTCLAKLFVDREIVQHSTNTIGFDHHVREVELDKNLTIKLQIWDTAGMEQFRSALVTKYYRNADGIVLVFDITRRDSFEHLELWIREVKQYCAGGLDRLRMVVIGNKLDKEMERQVSAEEAKSLIQKYRITEYVELSAMMASELDKLDGLFVRLSHEMVSVRQAMETSRSSLLSSKKDGTVIVLSEDWEVINAPEEPDQRCYAYRTQSRIPGKCSRC